MAREGLSFRRIGAVREAEHGLLEGPCAVAGGIVFSDVIAGGVFRLGPDDAESEVLARRRGIGGIVASADGGLIVTGRDLTHVAPDGVALDTEGCLWVATGPAATLLRLDPAGEPLGEFDVPASFVSSLCFAGPDLTTIYVTTAGSLLRAQAPVAGAPLPPARMRATLER